MQPSEGLLNLRWMAGQMMAEVSGVVTMVQEGRFQLTDDQGASHQFVLSRTALAETAQLRPLQTRQARVRVKYTDAPGLISRVAHRIDLFDPPPITERG